MRRAALLIALLTWTCLLQVVPSAYAQSAPEAEEEEAPVVEEAPPAEEEAETTADPTDPPPYTPPSVSFRSIAPHAAGESTLGPPLPNTDDLPSIDPEIFFDPSHLPGPLPPPPTVGMPARPGTKFTDIQADLIIQDRVEELVTLDGNVVVVYEDTTVRSAQGLLNEKDEVAAFWGDGGVEVESKDGILNTDDLTLEYADDVKKMTAVGSVHARVFPKEPKALPAKPTKRQKLENAFRERETILTGDELHYWWGTKEFHLWVEDKAQIATIVQEGRTAKATDIHYIKTPDEGVTFDGKVELWQKDGQWLYDHDLIEKKDSKVLKALMAVPSTVNCDLLKHSEKTKITTLDGSVVFTQDDKDAHADAVLIDDSPRRWEDPAEDPPGIIVVGTGIEVLSPAEVKARDIEWQPGAFVDEDGNQAENAEELEEIPLSEHGGQVLIATGDVYGHQKNGDWLFTYEVIEPDEEEKVKEDARKAAEGWAEKVIYRFDTEDIDASGNVRMKQPHQWGRADTILYAKDADQLTLQGEVQMRRRDKQMVLADEAILHLTSDVFEAFGHVESSLIANTDKQEPSDIEGGLTLIPLAGESPHVLQDPNAPPPESAPVAEGASPPATGDEKANEPAKESEKEEANPDAKKADEPAAAEATEEESGDDESEADEEEPDAKAASK